jgi:hypothetical protein
VRSRWSLVLIGALAALAFGPAACGGEDDGEPAATAPSEKPNSATESSPEEAAELAGTARFEQNAPVSDTPTVLVLEIRDGDWDLYGQPRGGQREEID